MHLSVFAGQQPKVLAKLRRELAGAFIADLLGNLPHAKLRAAQQLGGALHAVLTDMRGNGIAVYILENGLQGGRVHQELMRQLINGYALLQILRQLIMYPADHLSLRGGILRQGGALRGKNTFFIVEAEGMRVGHAGDLGHLPTRAQAAQIGRLDLLMLPVGGYYTIDAAQAMEVRRLLQPTVTVPMHYRTQYDPEMKIAPLADFLALSGAEDTQMPLLRAVKAEVGERPPVVTLAVQPG